MQRICCEKIEHQLIRTDYNNQNIYHNTNHHSSRQNQNTSHNESNKFQATSNEGAAHARGAKGTSA